jgi:hypothetical protein
LNEFSTPYRRGASLIRWYGHAANPPLFIPVQAADQVMNIGFRDVAMSGHISTRGVVTPTRPRDEDVWRKMLSQPVSDIWKG